MFYFERSYKVLNIIGKLSEKVFYDSIKPFKEQPPKEKELQSENKIKDLPSTLFLSFTADIINKNILFTR